MKFAAVLKPVLLALLLLAAGACSAPDAKTAAKTAPGAGASSAPKVTVVHPGRETLSRSISLAATVEAFEQVALYPKVSGYLKSLRVDIGDQVSKGELLGTLEIPEMRHQQAEARAIIAERKAEVLKAGAEARLRKVIFERSTGLRKKDAITEQQMDEARARYETAKARLEFARSRLKSAKARLARLGAMMAYTRLTSPFDGIVVARFVDPGTLMQAGTTAGTVTPIVTVARTDILRVVVDIPEMEAPHIRRGQAASLKVSAIADRTFHGKVTRFAHALEPATRTMRTEVDLPNTDGTLRPGMYGELTISLEERPDVLTLPENLVHHDKNGAFVYLLANGVAARHRVKPGLLSGGRVEIVSGLSEGAPVLAGASALKDGIAVRVSARQRNSHQAGGAE